jgi:CRP/FNR family cyclic AMP-dependent transcriptional regulator
MNTLTLVSEARSMVDALAMDEAARIRATLARVSLFADLGAEAQAQLAHRVTVRRALGGQLVVPAARAGEALYILMGGRVKLVMFGDSGREVTLAVLRPGDFFGEAAIFDGESRAVAAVALDPVTLLVLPKQDLLAHLDESPATARRLLTEMARRQRRVEETVAELALCDVSERLVRRLIALAREESGEGATELSIRRRPTQQDLANMVGSCRETVSRMFNQLARRGLIVPRGRGLLVTPQLLSLAASRAA